VVSQPYWKDCIHFFLPVTPRYSIEKIRKFVHAIGKLVQDADPKLATVSTKRDHKMGHVYIDFLQNGIEKTITAPLSIRALPNAPVSYPLTIKQLENNRLRPSDFTVRRAPRNGPALQRMRNLSEQMQQDLDGAFGKLGIKA
jgi:bifunctional non-homologous end joining protein LigD